MLFTEKNGTRKNFAKDPAVVKFGGRYFLYYSSYYKGVAGKEVLGIGIAASEDLDHFEAVSTVPFTQQCEENGIGAPAAVVLGGKVHLFYQTYGNGRRDAICHAVSADGLHFEKDGGNPVFRPGENWCCGRAIDADVAVIGDKLYLYFATRDHEMIIQKIGVACAPLSGGFSRGEWKECVSQAVLAPEYSWEEECTEAPAALVKDGKVWLFYGGAYNCSPQQIGLAVSSDGVFFRKTSDKPFLPAGEAGSWNSSESGHPYVFADDDGRTYLFYQGSSDNGVTWYLSKRELLFDGGVPALAKEAV